MSDNATLSQVGKSEVIPMSMYDIGNRLVQAVYPAELAERQRRADTYWSRDVSCHYLRAMVHG